MAKTKYWRLKVKGTLSPDEAQAAVSDREGTLLRVHSEKDETDVYFASAQEAKSTAKLSAGSLKEVSLADVTKIR